MKTCFKCKKTLPVEAFYTHPETADGHLGKCKRCTRADTQKRYLRIKDTPEEKIRQKEKQIKAAALFPEKVKAKKATSKMTRSKGNHLHHWSYLRDHFKDVFEFSPEQHRSIHSFMIYDPERKQYRKLSGELIDSRAKAEEYYYEVLSIEPF